MRNRIIPAVVSASLVLAMLACSLPGRPAAGSPDLAGTITAQAEILQAATITAQAGALQSLSATPAPGDTAAPPSDTPAPADTPRPANTPLPAAPSKPKNF